MNMIFEKAKLLNIVERQRRTEIAVLLCHSMEKTIAMDGCSLSRLTCCMSEGIASELSAAEQTLVEQQHRQLSQRSCRRLWLFEK